MTTNRKIKTPFLEMIAEFDAAKSYMHGGVGSTWKRAKNYEGLVTMVRQQEDANARRMGEAAHEKRNQDCCA